MTQQLTFGFMQAIDDESQGTIDGALPVGFIHRCYYPDAETALVDARRAARFLSHLFIIEYPVTEGFEKCWPHPTLWRISQDKPCVGVSGAYYCSRPNYYVIKNGQESFVAAEDPADVERKQAAALKAYQSKKQDGRY